MTKLIQLFAVFVCLGTTARSGATENDFYLGTWLAGGEAAVSILGNLRITATDISWNGSRSSPKCHTTYTVVDSSNGPHPYPDEGWPSKEIPSDATYATVKIRLAKAKCLDGAAVASNQSNHLDVILYNNSDQPRGWFGFGRIK
jgi:hypothetical protein